MTKSELIDELCLQTKGSLHKDMEAVVDAVFESMAAALQKKDRVEIRGFGVFLAKARKARGARNPRTGDKVSVPDKYVPFFTVGKELRERINNSPSTGK